MKSFVCSLFILIFFPNILNAQQDNKVKLYDPNADAKVEIASAVALADSLGKNVLLQIGGNWCKWCLRFNKFCSNDSVIDTLLHNNYVVLHVNYSPDNQNLEVLKTLDFPQRFGFPVIVILDNKGKRIHTQDTALLESGDGYDREKVMSFLRLWTTKALNPIYYTK
jgi:thioredoxin-related protein